MKGILPSEDRCGGRAGGHGLVVVDILRSATVAGWADEIIAVVDSDAEKGGGDSAGDQSNGKL